MKLTKALSLLTICSLIIISCSKDETKTPVTEPAPKPPLVNNTNIDTISRVNWDNRSDGSYSTTTATSDFKLDAYSWNSRATIVSKQLRVLLLKDLLSGSGGIVAGLNLTPAPEYRVTYDLKFDSNFDWGKGGKVGFGFLIGDGNTGCDKADDGNGASARLMWYTSDNGNVRFKPYLYYKDMPDNCGDNVVSSATFPSSGSIQKNKWYKVVVHVKSNIGSNKDGLIKISIDGTTILNESMRWTTNDNKRLIDKLTFATFRGGSSDDWKTSTDGYIYFDNLILERIK